MAMTARINNNKMLLFKPFSISGLRCISSMARSRKGKTAETEAEATAEQGRRSTGDAAGCWVPHPRTGIYFPRGQEWVMDDIPNGAASFDCTFWLRGGIDGVDHHKQDHHDIDTISFKHFN